MNWYIPCEARATLSALHEGVDTVEYVNRIWKTRYPGIEKASNGWPVVRVEDQQEARVNVSKLPVKARGR